MLVGAIANARHAFRLGRLLHVDDPECERRATADA